MKKMAWLLSLIVLVACAPAATPTPTPTAIPPSPTPTWTPTATPTPAPCLGIRDNPCQLKEEASVYDYDYGALLTVSITQVVRGDKAWQMIQEANVSNEPPSAGKEYLVAYVVAKYHEGPGAQTYGINTFEFNYLDERSWLLPVADTVIEPELRLSDALPVYEGGVMKGWLAFEVPEGDANLMVAFGLDRLGLGAVWFRLCPLWPFCK